MLFVCIFFWNAKMQSINHVPSHISYSKRPIFTQIYFLPKYVKIFTQIYRQHLRHFKRVFLCWCCILWWSWFRWTFVLPWDMLVMSELLVLISKHLKGQLDPPVGNGHVFGSKVVRWISLLETSRFWIKGGQLDLLVGNVTSFGWEENLSLFTPPETFLICSFKNTDLFVKKKYISLALISC